MKNIYKLFYAFVLATIATTSFAQETPNYDAIHTSKVAKENTDGSYTLTLETFVEGEYNSETTTTKTTNPVDFVLCLDISGSMKDPLVGTDVYATKGSLWWNVLEVKPGHTLDTEKGSREGYYAAIISAAGAYRKVRYHNSKWQYYNETFSEWIQIDNSTFSCTIFKSKLGALMDACDAFLNKIEISQQEGSLNGSNGHKVGVVTFADNATNVLGLTNINSKGEIANAIHSLKTGGATAADYGLQNAINMLSLNNNGNGRSKALVLFTDGEPNHGSGFNTTVANSCISSAKGAKDKNAMVFSINVLEASEGSNMWKYLNYVSSNYPTATSLSNPGTAAEKQKYYHLATNENALNDAFEAVVTQAITTTGGASIDLKVSEVTLRDVVSTSFVIPNGLSSVRIYEVPVLTTVPSSHSITDITFKTLSESEKVKPASVTYTVENNIVDVKGYDFSAKWVGYKITKKNNSTPSYAVNPTGAKLVIEITIVPDPNDEGGCVKTNDDSSGVYVGDVQVTNNNKKPYITPDPVFTPMDLKIEKSGLKAGESVLYTITRSGDNNFSMQVILTADADGTASTTVAKVPVKDASGNFYNYTVTEDNTWDWAYAETTTLSHTLGTYNSTTKTFSKNNKFEIPTSASSAAGSNVNHAEDYKINKFAK